MIYNLSQEEDVYGALVLGTHSLRFAKGPSVKKLLPRNNKDEMTEDSLDTIGEYKVVYSFSDKTRFTKSFLMINGSEVNVASLLPSDAFQLDAGNFCSGNFKSGSPMQIDPGLLAVIAPTRWGKSTLMYGGLLPAVVDVDPVAINFVEIHEDTHGYITSYTAIEENLLRQLLLAIMTPRTAISIDSLRAFVYAKSVGGTGTAGLDQYFSIQLTALSNTFANTGCLAIVTINPLVDYNEEKDKKRYNEIVNQLVASTSFAIAGTDKMAADMYPRGFSHPSREPISVRISDLSERTLNDGGSARKGEDLYRSTSTTVISVAEVDNSAVNTARRLIVASTSSAKDATQ